MASAESSTQCGNDDKSNTEHNYDQSITNSNISSNISTGSTSSNKQSNSSNDIRSKWLNSVLTFMKEAQASNLDLSRRTMTKNEILFILTALTKSQITELDLNSNNLQDTVKYLTRSFGQTRLQKLNIRACDLTRIDFLLLLKLLKRTSITDLDISSNHILFDPATVKPFLSFLLQSSITNLSIEKNSFNGEAGTMFFQSLPNTSITHLNLNGTMRREEFGDVITSLISILPQTSITDLDLSYNRLTLTELEKLSESLRASKLRKLNLSWNGISDNGINALTKGLVNSKIIDLDLSFNKFCGSNDLGRSLKDTRIETLCLNDNRIEHDQMFNFPDFLKGSVVRCLNVNRCYFGDKIGQKLIKSLASTEINELHVGKNHLEKASIFEFSQILEHTNLTIVDFSFNFLSPEALSILGDSLQGSKLTNIDLRGNIEAFENQCTLVESLANTSLTNVNLSFCQLNPVGALRLAAALKYTLITHLELEGNDLRDEGSEALTEALKQTQIVKLNISRNGITSKGAKALANAFKNTHLLYLNFKSNPIKDDDVLYFAQEISSTFITILDVRDYLRRESDYVLDGALWENRKTVLQFIDCFKRLAPEESNNFQFDRSADSSNLDSLFEDCLFFYKTVVERPSSLNILVQEKSFSHSKSQITDLMEHFPRQFATFIARSVEADVTEHMNLLKKIEELGLSKITEHLLLHRPLYVIDESEDILHPYVYKLMHKYKQPIVNSSIEPRGKDRIINYFTKHKDVEGASDIICLLHRNGNDSNVDIK